jgi:hypothetical protein
MAEGALQASRGYSGEQSRPRGGGIGCAKAGTTSGEGWGTPRAKEQSRGGAKSTRHRASAADRQGRAPTSANSLRQGIIGATRARGKVPHLGTALGDSRRGVWSFGWTAQRARFSGELGRR